MGSTIRYNRWLPRSTSCCTTKKPTFAIYCHVYITTTRTLYMYTQFLATICDSYDLHFGLIRLGRTLETSHHFALAMSYDCRCIQCVWLACTFSHSSSNCNARLNVWSCIQYRYPNDKFCNPPNDLDTLRPSLGGAFPIGRLVRCNWRMEEVDDIPWLLMLCWR